MSENDEDTGDCETIELIELPQNKQKRKEPLGVAPIVTATVTAARFGFRGCCALFVASACIILVRVVLIAYNRIAKSAPKSAPTYGNSTFPEVLLESDGVYSVEDFKNPLGRSPRYWNDLLQTQDHNSSTIPHWGPCYEPKLSLNEDDWRRLILSSKERESDNYVKYVLKDYDKEMSQNIRNGHNTNTESKNKDLSGLCRPGFLIIGVGKCGTSSLYQYLVGHPRVLPAFRKQIHYFKYYTKYPMKWYLSNFPTTESFVSSGALMTGESSPGYIPYPDVAQRVKTWMARYAGDGHDPLDDHSPAIIVIAREPLDRAYSSYKYSYLDPALKKLRLGRHSTALRNQKDDYYADYLFSFEEMIEAELTSLKECLKPGGYGEIDTREFYIKTSWAVTEFERREREGLAPMINLDQSCYGKESKVAPRAQWDELVKKNPKKLIDLKNLHLLEAFIGRGLYSLPLDWYYALYPEKDIYLVCTEDLKRQPAATMSDLSDFLGLPPFNFTDVVYKGMYNVGTHQGYETATKWKTGNEHTDIPISVKLKEEVLSFIKPYTERLFAMTKKKCDWM